MHRIVYIFTQFVGHNDIRFDARYLPCGFQAPGDPGVNTGVGITYPEMSFIALSFTRDGSGVDLNKALKLLAKESGPAELL